LARVDPLFCAASSLAEKWTSVLHKETFMRNLWGLHLSCNIISWCPHWIVCEHQTKCRHLTLSYKLNIIQEISGGPFICLWSLILLTQPLLRSTGQTSWLQIQRSQVRFPVLLDFLSSSGCIFLISMISWCLSSDTYLSFCYKHQKFCPDWHLKSINTLI
jgi:hypothetical protein